MRWLTARKALWRTFSAALPVSFAVLLIVIQFFGPFERLVHGVFGRALEIQANAPNVTIITRTDQAGSQSEADTRLELAQIVRSVQSASPRHIVVLDQLNEATSPEADLALEHAIRDSRAPVLLVVGGEYALTERGGFPLPLRRFQDNATVTHHVQIIAESAWDGVIGRVLKLEDGTTLRHVATTVTSSKDPDYYYPLDARIRTPVSLTVPAADLLRGQADAKFLAGDTVIVEAAKDPAAPLIVRRLSDEQEAVEVSQAIHALRTGAPALISPTKLTIAILIAAVLWSLAGGRAITYVGAIALSFVWALVAFLLIAFRMYVPVIGVVLLLLSLAAAQRAWSADERARRRARLINPVTQLPNALAFEEERHDKGVVIFAISYRGSRNVSTNLQQIARRGRALIDAMKTFHVGDATLVAFVPGSRVDACREWALREHTEDQRVNAVFWSDHADHSMAEITEVLEISLQECQRQSTAFKVVDTMEKAVPAPPMAQNIAAISVPTLVFDLHERKACGVMVDLATMKDRDHPVDQLAARLSSALKSASRHQKNDLWAKLDLEAVLDPKTNDLLVTIAGELFDEERRLVVCFDDLFKRDLDGLSREALRALSKAGATICGSSLAPDAPPFECVLAAPAQIMGLALPASFSPAAASRIALAAQNFAHSLSRELVVWDASTPQLSSALAEAGVRYACGAGVQASWNDQSLREESRDRFTASDL